MTDAPLARAVERLRAELKLPDTTVVNSHLFDGNTCGAAWVVEKNSHGLSKGWFAQLTPHLEIKRKVFPCWVREGAGEAHEKQVAMELQAYYKLYGDAGFLAVQSEHSKPSILVVVRHENTLRDRLASLSAEADQTSTWVHRLALTRGVLNAVHRAHSQGFAHRALDLNAFAVDGVGDEVVVQLQFFGAAFCAPPSSGDQHSSDVQLSGTGDGGIAWASPWVGHPPKDRESLLWRLFDWKGKKVRPANLKDLSIDEAKASAGFKYHPDAAVFNHKCDMGDDHWSLALVLYEIFHGKVNADASAHQAVSFYVDSCPSMSVDDIHNHVRTNCDDATKWFQFPSQCNACLEGLMLELFKFSQPESTTSSDHNAINRARSWFSVPVGPYVRHMLMLNVRDIAHVLLNASQAMKWMLSSLKKGTCPTDADFATHPGLCEALQRGKPFLKKTYIQGMDAQVQTAWDEKNPSGDFIHFDHPLLTDDIFLWRALAIVRNLVAHPTVTTPQLIARTMFTCSKGHMYADLQAAIDAAKGVLNAHTATIDLPSP